MKLTLWTHLCTQSMPMKLQVARMFRSKVTGLRKWPKMAEFEIFERSSKITRVWEGKNDMCIGWIDTVEVIGVSFKKIRPPQQAEKWDFIRFWEVWKAAILNFRIEGVEWRSWDVDHWISRQNLRNGRGQNANFRFPDGSRETFPNFLDTCVIFR